MPTKILFFKVGDKGVKVCGADEEAGDDRPYASAVAVWPLRLVPVVAAVKNYAAC